MRAKKQLKGSDRSDFSKRERLIPSQEGVLGLIQHLKRGAKKSPQKEAKERYEKLVREFNEKEKEAKERYEKLVREFNEKVSKGGYGDLSGYLWYHTIDLGNGLVTPGIFDYRSKLPLFKFPQNMKGMNVLDIGAATGFFSFEFEKRGANVLSVELPSLADWDIPQGKIKEEVINSLMKVHKVNTVKKLDYLHLHAPFDFCKKMLKSKVKRCYSKIEDLSGQKLGRESFDLIFLGGLLVHTFSPLKALDAVAPLCKGTIIITHPLPNIRIKRPVMLYTGEEMWSGNRGWWLPNLQCLNLMLKKVGFKEVSVVGNIRGVMGLWGHRYNHFIIHAKK